MIVQATLAAIEKAATEYVSFSGGDSSWSAREAFYTTCIAQRIGKLRNAPPVTLESRISDTMKAAGCRRCRQHWGKKRFDIVLWDDESPTAAVEVKRVHDYNQIVQNDVTRICDVLNELNKKGNDNSFQYGILAHLVSGQSKDNNGQHTFGHLRA